jgi:hypothetical protein
VKISRAAFPGGMVRARADSTGEPNLRKLPQHHVRPDETARVAARAISVPHLEGRAVPAMDNTAAPDPAKIIPITPAAHEPDLLVLLVLLQRAQMARTLTATLRCLRW